MVQRLGCLDSAAEVIAARTGNSVNKGTLSKKMSGSLDWTVSDIVALEDALSTYPVTQSLGRRLGREAFVRGCLMTEGALLAKEAGEAVAAVMRAANAATATAADRASAIQELSEAEDMLRRCRTTLEAHQ